MRKFYCYDRELKAADLKAKQIKIKHNKGKVTNKKSNGRRGGAGIYQSAIT
jgi:hypothetical protein